MNIIGISGLAGSGKDTVADILAEDRTYVKIALADEMKRICMRVYPEMTEDHLWGPSQKRNEPIKAYPRTHGPWVEKDGEKYCGCCGGHILYEERGQCYLTARHALQQLGTEWGRAMYEDTWVDTAIRQATKLLTRDGSIDYRRTEGLFVRKSVPHYYAGVVISDVRWPAGNEGQAIRKAGGILVRMKRGEGLGGAAGQHASEKYITAVPDDYFDVVFDNREWSLEELKTRVLDFKGHRARLLKEEAKASHE